LDIRKRLYTYKSSFSGNFYKDPLFILILITALVTFYLLSVQIRIGVPYWDVFNYLNNALYFAGRGEGGILYLPPVIPFITSIFFRFGYVSQNAIFIIDSLIFIIGITGFYLLLNQSFNKIQSFTGSIIFLSLAVLMPWIASGGIDIPGVCFSIWALLFTVMGVKKNSKFFYMVIPMIMLSFLTRYTAGLIVIPIIFYSLINIKRIKNIKKVILGLLIELLILIAIFLYFFISLDAINNFYSLLTAVITSTAVGKNDVASNPNIFYYIQNILNYISIYPFRGSYVQLLNPSLSNPSLISIITIIIAIFSLFSFLNRNITSKSKMKGFISKKSNIVKIVTIIILVAALFIVLGSLNLILSELIFLAICFMLYSLFGSLKIKYFDLTLMYFSWFGSYLIFQSILSIKVDRYFITMAPAFVYFIMLGFNEFINTIKPKINDKNLKKWGIYSIIAIIFLSSSTVAFTGHMPKKTFTRDIEDASYWLKDYDPDYKQKIIYSDYPPAVSWYLKTKVTGGFPGSFKTSEMFSAHLKKNNVDYYIDSISNPKPDIIGYQVIKSIESVKIYKKV